VAAPLLGDAQPQQRFLQVGGRLRLELRAAVFGQRRLRLLACALGSVAVDLLRSFGHVGQYDHFVGADFQEAARDGQVMLFAAAYDT